MLGKLLDRRVAWFVALLSFLVLSNCGSDPSAGAIGTGNAGRIQGQVVASGNLQTSRLAARLVSVGTSDQVVDSTRCDSNGVFRFPEHQTGKYRVEIWQSGKFHGSRTFQLAGDLAGLVIVLVEAVFQQELDLSRIGNVDSVYIDYRQNQGIRVGTRWLVQTTRDSAFVVHAHLPGPPGRWEEWVVVRREGRDVLVNITDNRSLELVRTIDSGAFLLTPHTVALWDFDTLLTRGSILDRSPWGNHLLYEGDHRLVPSPHGKAFAQSSGIAAVAPYSDQLSPSLRWTRTGTMTWEIRFRLDSLPLAGMVVLGSENGIRLWVMGGRQLVLESLVEQNGGLTFGSLVTESGVVPVGKWVDIAISVDGPNQQMHAWIDETPMPLYVRTNWIPGTQLRLNTAGEFGIGGSLWDPRRSYFQIDEARISDTLVYGPGLPILTTNSLTVEGSVAAEGAQVFDKAGSADPCTDCRQVVVGLDPSVGKVGGFAWKPTLPSNLQGKRIASALLMLWTSSGAVSQRRDFLVHSILAPWTGGPSPLVWSAGSGIPFGSRIDSTPGAASLLVPGSSGGLVFEVSQVVQRWVDSPASNHGFLVRATDGSLGPIDFQGAGSVMPPSLLVRYR